MSKKTENTNYKIISENRRARYDYLIEDDIECGISLEGSEVKSLRTGKTQIGESYASVENTELWLVNCYIPPYTQANAFSVILGFPTPPCCNNAVNSYLTH